MGRPRKPEQLVGLSGRIRPEQDRWLRWEAERRFEGELSRTLRWALEQAQAFSLIMMHDDPVFELDRALHPDKYPPDDDNWPTDEQRAAERLRRERALAQAYGLKEQP
jgi:hypothetical protein